MQMAEAVMAGRVQFDQRLVGTFDVGIEKVRKKLGDWRVELLPRPACRRTSTCMSSAPQPKCQIAEVISDGGGAATLLNSSHDFCAKIAGAEPANGRRSQSKRVA